jgi:hypothetical protein
METTNLVEGVIAVAIAATAVAAIIAAYFSWVQGRQRVVIEGFEFVKGDLAGAPEFTLVVTLSNLRRSSIQPLLLEVRGLPNANISCPEGPPKSDRQRLNEAVFPYMQIPPYQAAEAAFNIAFDWQGARAAAPAAGGDLPWQAVATFIDRARRGKRVSQELDLVFQGAVLHRLTAGDSQPVERRKPGRPFSNA